MSIEQIELLKFISLVCYILAGLFLVGAVILFFILDVPRVYGEVTGKTARKAISQMRQRNEDGEVTTSRRKIVSSGSGDEPVSIQSVNSSQVTDNTKTSFQGGTRPLRPEDCAPSPSGTQKLSEFPLTGAAPITLCLDYEVRFTESLETIA